MQEYYFLFLIALAWTSFAAVQDWKRSEISNWLNFSLIAFVLAYRAFYSIFAKDLMFFVYGAFGVLLFVGLAYLFYYARVFGGGDAKLLMGLGGVLPFESFYDYFIVGLGFIFVLFLVGSIYSIIYSAFLVFGKKNDFFKDFRKRFFEWKWLVFIALIFGVSLILVNIFLTIFIIFIPFLFLYVKSLDKCMIKYVKPDALMEGDWLERDVAVGKKIIKKTVHGLSFEEIKILKKAKKNVLIKTGIPFAPVFLISLSVFALILIYGYDFLFLGLF